MISIAGEAPGVAGMYVVFVFVTVLLAMILAALSVNDGPAIFSVAIAIFDFAIFLAAVSLFYGALTWLTQPQRRARTLNVILMFMIGFISLFGITLFGAIPIACAGALLIRRWRHGADIKYWEVAMVYPVIPMTAPYIWILVLPSAASGLLQY